MNSPAGDCRREAPTLDFRRDAPTFGAGAPTLDFRRRGAYFGLSVLRPTFALRATFGASAYFRLSPCGLLLAFGLL